MLTQEPTEEMIREWFLLFSQYRSALQPNRKSGAEVDCYFREQYGFPAWDAPDFAMIVAANITDNPDHAAKLPPGTAPDIRTYRKGDIMVGIDLASGYFQIECEDIDRIVPLYDDLFCYRGLDERDLDNPFLVAEFVRLRQKSLPND